jgi:hypothetical protein
MIHLKRLEDIFLEFFPAKPQFKELSLVMNTKTIALLCIKETTTMYRRGTVRIKQKKTA